MAKFAGIDCDYCGKPAKLVTGDAIYPGNSKVQHKHFWHCEPCNAWVGCYEQSPTLKPVGKLADAKLRKARREFHGVFDMLWMSGFLRLTQTAGSGVTKHDCISIAYKWLSERMGIRGRDCNVGNFNLDQCINARKICETLGNELLSRYNTEADKNAKLS